MRLRWNWRRRTEPGNGRDATGRLVDGDTVRPPGWPGWTDALSARPVELVDASVRLGRRGSS